MSKIEDTFVPDSSLRDSTARAIVEIGPYVGKDLGERVVAKMEEMARSAAIDELGKLDGELLAKEGE